MRFLLALAGFLLGMLAGRGLAGSALLGALAGLLVAELVELRHRVAQLEAHAQAARNTRTAVPPELDPAPAAPAAAVLPAAEQPVAAAVAAATAWPVRDPYAPSTASYTASDAASGGGAASRWALLWQPLVALFTRGNIVARAGVLVLLCGVGFLLHYLAEHSHIPMAWRLAAVASGGAALLLLGLALARRRGYGLVLQAGGVGVLYLTAYVALTVYALVSPVLTLAALVALAILSAALAVAQGSQAFAVLAVMGGFLAPVLTGSGDDSPLILLSYYLALNGSILGIALHRAGRSGRADNSGRSARPWRVLNGVGFVLTVALTAAWGVGHYQDSLLAITEPFLWVFFLLYLAMVILLARREPHALGGYVDTMIVFGAPAAALGFQAGMLQDRPHALGASALLLSGIYGLLGWVMRPLRAAAAPLGPSGPGGSRALLAQCFSALAVMCLTAALPLATHGRHWGALWALEGAALIWVGCQQRLPLARAAGAVLLALSGVLCGLITRGALQPLLPAYAPAALAVDCATLGIAALCSAVILRRNAARLLLHEAYWPAVMVLWGLGWWLYGVMLAIIEYVPDPYGLAAGLLAVSATAVAAGEIGVRTALRPARLAALALLPVMELFALLTLISSEHPLGSGGQLAWPLAFAALYVVCARNEDTLTEQPLTLLHAGSALLLLALGSWEIAYQLGVVGARIAWPSLGWALLPAIVLAVLPALIRNVAWPLRRHAAIYRGWVGGTLAAYLIIWSVVSYCGLPRVTYPGQLVPLLQGVDLGEVGVFLALAAYWRALALASQEPDASGSRELPGLPMQLDKVLLALVIFGLHATLLRGLHFWAGVDYELGALLASTLVQSALSIFWAAMALMLMVLATLRASRRLWLGGAALLGGVILKLFLIDLSSIGTIERIVSFLGVGVLTLVIGYFAPDAPGQGAGASGQGAPQEPPRS